MQFRNKFVIFSTFFVLKVGQREQIWEQERVLGFSLYFAVYGTPHFELHQ